MPKSLIRTVALSLVASLLADPVWAVPFWPQQASSHHLSISLFQSQTMGFRLLNFFGKKPDAAAMVDRDIGRIHGPTVTESNRFELVETLGERSLKENVAGHVQLTPPLSSELTQKINHLRSLRIEVRLYRPPKGESKVPEMGGIYVPADLKNLARALIHLNILKPGDTFLDLGSGEGDVVAMVAELFGARAVGVESNYVRWAKSRHLVDLLKREDSEAVHGIKFVNDDYLQTDWRAYDVVYYYVFGAHPAVEPKIIEKIQRDLKPGGRFLILGIPDESHSSYAYPDIRPLLDSTEFQLTRAPDLGVLALTRKNLAKSMGPAVARARLGGLAKRRNGFGLADAMLAFVPALLPLALAFFSPMREAVVSSNGLVFILFIFGSTAVVLVDHLLYRRTMRMAIRVSSKTLAPLLKKAEEMEKKFNGHFVMAVTSFISIVPFLPVLNGVIEVDLWWSILFPSAIMAFAQRPVTKYFVAKRQVVPFVTSGPYRWTRNPLYLIHLLIITFPLIGALERGYWGVLGAYAGIMVLIWRMVRWEELKHLLQSGRDFEDYMNRVPRWLWQFPATAFARRSA